jgi:hypothetical protein
MSRPAARSTAPSRALALIVALPLVLAVLPGSARAQRALDLVARGDSLLRRGQLFAAESAYYDAARLSPRDPAARLALGRYLAARGALRIGAVLMEEARFFGGDAKTVGTELAPLSSAERGRAEWLRDHAPAYEGPDSVVVPYEPQAGAGDGLGRVALTLGGQRVEATIDPTVRGLVLDTSWARRPGVKTFGGRGGREAGVASPVAVVSSLTIGELALSNQPARLVPTGGASRARVGLDLFADLATTFDEPAKRLTLRRGGRVARSLAGDRLPTLALPSGVWLATASGTSSLAVDRGRTGLRGRRWTLDGRRGEIVVER